MKELLSTSLLQTLMSGEEESTRLLEILQTRLESNHRFYVTSLAILEILRTKKWMNPEDQREFLHQSGILCEEIYPITKEDIRLSSELIEGKAMRIGLETIELAVSVNREMDTLLVYGSSIDSKMGIKVIDLKTNVER